MSRVKQVYDRLSPLMREFAQVAPPVEPFDPVNDFFYFAERYSAAGDILSDVMGAHIHPRMQLYGHSIECALKAYLTAKNAQIPRGNDGHNLIKLAETAEQIGCYISEMQAITLVQISSLYFKDIGTDTAYKARYPSKPSESNKSITGNFGNVRELVESIKKQVGA